LNVGADIMERTSITDPIELKAAFKTSSGHPGWTIFLT
jgi:hypothetical protein